jgi:hypothetical protein
MTTMGGPKMLVSFTFYGVPPIRETEWQEFRFSTLLVETPWEREFEKEMRRQTESETCIL